MAVDCPGPLKVPKDNNLEQFNSCVKHALYSIDQSIAWIGIEKFVIRLTGNRKIILNRFVDTDSMNNWLLEPCLGYIGRMCMLGYRQHKTYRTFVTI